jgi:adenosylhomocysteine nucleosidase
MKVNRSRSVYTASLSPTLLATSMSRSLPPILVVVALEVETQDCFAREAIPVLYTGIGKVNATYALTKKLAEYRTASLPSPIVVNFGTAGSRKHGRGTMLECTRFVQRDMDVSGLGFQVGVTPFENVPTELTTIATFHGLQQGTCSSGDSFETRGIAHECDVIDMEAYAVAKVCWFEKVRFACAKFVTDGADHTASNDWQSSLQDAAKAFLSLYLSIERSFER